MLQKQHVLCFKTLALYYSRNTKYFEILIYIPPENFKNNFPNQIMKKQEILVEAVKRFSKIYSSIRCKYWPVRRYER